VEQQRQSKMKWVYVTGCDTGFGRLAVGMLVKKGYGVIPGCFLSKSMEELSTEFGDKVEPVLLDVSKNESVTEAATKIEKFLLSRPGDCLDAVVNNAGVLTAPGPAEWTDIETYEKMMNINFFGTVRVTRSVLPLIRASQGRIINVASIAGRISLPSQPAYCPSKYAVEAYSDVLRKDMLPWNVRVVIVEPGVFNKTNLYGNYQTGLDENWEKLPQKLKDDYGQGFKDYFRRLLGSSLNDFGNTNSNLVPEAYIEAITAKKPKYRYRVGVDSKFIITIISWLPEGIQDLLLTISDSKNPMVPPTAAPKNGRSLALKGYQGPKYKLYIGLLVLFILYRKMK